HWLTPRRILRHHNQRGMAAKLVVLSACQTALGGFHEGGVIGLARAFQLAGASRVVMSQWSVSDEHTEALMRRFVDALEGGYAPHDALREAMRSFRREHPEPAFWAPFTLFGTPAGVE